MKSSRLVAIKCPACGLTVRLKASEAADLPAVMLLHLKKDKYCREECCERPDLLARIPGMPMLVISITLHCYLRENDKQVWLRGLTPSGEVVDLYSYRSRQRANKEVRQIIRESGCIDGRS